MKIIGIYYSNSKNLILEENIGLLFYANSSVKSSTLNIAYTSSQEIYDNDGHLSGNVYTNIVENKPFTDSYQKYLNID